MTTQEMNKYAYELMVKNNLDETVKQLLLKDKIINDLQQRIKELEEENKKLKEVQCTFLGTGCKRRLQELEDRMNKAIEYINRQLEYTKNCLEYNREQHNFYEVEKYTRDYNLYTSILEKIKGEENGTL